MKPDDDKEESRSVVCWNPLCSRQAKLSFKLCARCKLATYCSKECQKQDWPLHKDVCTQTPGEELPKTPTGDKRRKKKDAVQTLSREEMISRLLGDELASQVLLNQCFSEHTSANGAGLRVSQDATSSAALDPTDFSFDLVLEEAWPQPTDNTQSTSESTTSTTTTSTTTITTATTTTTNNNNAVHSLDPTSNPRPSPPSAAPASPPQPPPVLPLCDPPAPNPALCNANRDQAEECYQEAMACVADTSSPLKQFQAAKLLVKCVKMCPDDPRFIMALAQTCCTLQPPSHVSDQPMPDLDSPLNTSAADATNNNKTPTNDDIDNNNTSNNKKKHKNMNKPSSPHSTPAQPHNHSHSHNHNHNHTSSPPPSSPAPRDTSHDGSNETQGSNNSSEVSDTVPRSLSSVTRAVMTIATLVLQWRNALEVVFGVLFAVLVWKGFLFAEVALAALLLCSSTIDKRLSPDMADVLVHVRWGMQRRWLCPTLCLLSVTLHTSHRPTMEGWAGDQMRWGAEVMFHAVVMAVVVALSYCSVHLIPLTGFLGVKRDTAHRHLELFRVIWRQLALGWFLVSRGALFTTWTGYMYAVYMVFVVGPLFTHRIPTFTHTEKLLTGIWWAVLLYWVVWCVVKVVWCVVATAWLHMGFAIKTSGAVAIMMYAAWMMSSKQQQISLCVAGLGGVWWLRDSVVWLLLSTIKWSLVLVAMLVVVVLVFALSQPWNEAIAQGLQIVLLFVSVVVNVAQLFLEGVVVLCDDVVKVSYLLIDRAHWIRPGVRSALRSHTVTDPSRIECGNTIEEELGRVMGCSEGDMYNVLGVSPLAAPTLIKTAYMRKARMLHPDKNNHHNAQRAFNRVVAAYEVLCDEQQRHEYDLLCDTHQPPRPSLTQADMEDFKLPVVLCAKCRVPHRQTETTLDVKYARYCSECINYHQSRDGECWAEDGFIVGKKFYVCMQGKIFDVTSLCECKGFTGPFNTHVPLFTIPLDNADDDSATPTNSNNNNNNNSSNNNSNNSNNNNSNNTTSMPPPFKRNRKRS